ncbi:MAG: hypothetical protein RI897_577 [Verrucomicrobiota bacterium]
MVRGGFGGYLMGPADEEGDAVAGFEDIGFGAAPRAVGLVVLGGVAVDGRIVAVVRQVIRAAVHV